MSDLYNFVNIIGYGYVGGAIGYLCKKNKLPYCTYDVLKKDERESVENFNDISSLIKSSEQKNEHNFYLVQRYHSYHKPIDLDVDKDILAVSLSFFSYEFAP